MEKKRVLNVDSTNWNESQVADLKKKIRENYEWQVKYQEPGGKIRWAYLNEEDKDMIPIVFKAENYKLLKMVKL